MTLLDGLPVEPVLRILVITIVALFAAAVSLAVFVLIQHALRERNEARARALEARWGKTLQEVLAGDAEPDALIALVESHERWHFADYLTDFAILLRGEELALARDVARITLPGLATVINEGSAPGRARNVRALALLGGVDYSASLVRALASPSTLVSMTAARWLCRPEYAGQVDDVISRLSRFPFWSPRFLGLLLARFGRDAAPALRPLLDSRAPEPERVGAARALWWIKDAAAAEVAARLLAQPDLPSSLAEACLRLLERCGVEAHAEVARRWSDQADVRVQSAALGALAAVGTDADIERVKEKVRVAPPVVALEAAHALARSARTQLESLARGPDERAASIAREALAS